jgi:sterol desaturase/sphingolipid hydroxylase (fatty acid hydroxylase superfamily)
MDESLFSQTQSLRLFSSLGFLAFFWGLALLIPFRKSKEIQNPKRWFNNLIFNFGNGFLVFLVMPLSLIELSQSEWTSSYSILAADTLPPAAHVILSVLLLDFVIYWQHRLFHFVPALWRLHRLHHSDTEFDTTTAGRFHSFEIFLSFFIKATFVILFSIPAAAIIAFEILLNAAALFNHSNFQLPASLEKVFRRIIITPDIHRTHHSVEHDHMNSNFGFSISLWDQIFKTFRTQPQEVQASMPIGLKEFRSPKEQTFLSLFMQPFR